MLSSSNQVKIGHKTSVLTREYMSTLDRLAWVRERYPDAHKRIYGLKHRSVILWNQITASWHN